MVSLAGDLFAMSGSDISESFQLIFLEFLKRLTDTAMELLGYNDVIRKQVVCVLSDAACHALTSMPLGTIKLISESMRDKSVSIAISACAPCMFFIFSTSSISIMITIFCMYPALLKVIQWRGYLTYTGSTV